MVVTMVDRDVMTAFDYEIYPDAVLSMLSRDLCRYLQGVRRDNRFNWMDAALDTIEHVLRKANGKLTPITEGDIYSAVEGQIEQALENWETLEVIGWRGSSLAWATLPSVGRLDFEVGEDWEEEEDYGEEGEEEEEEEEEGQEEDEEEEDLSPASSYED